MARNEQQSKLVREREGKISCVIRVAAQTGMRAGMLWSMTSGKMVAWITRGENVRERLRVREGRRGGVS